MRGAALGICLALGVGAWAALGESRRARVDDAMQTVRDGAQDASTNVQERISDYRTEARITGLEQIVSDRLHGDKTLGAEKIEVSVLVEGTAILKGLVPNAAAKEKAVSLTRDTRGVLRVVDRLAVMPPPRYYGTPVPKPEPEPAVATRPRNAR